MTRSLTASARSTVPVEPNEARPVRPAATFIVIGAVLTLLAFTVAIGADTMWLVALGDAIARTGHVPVGAPFLTADTSAWVNVPVLGELIFAGVHHLGALGLPALQLTVDGVLLGLVARDARLANARDTAAALALLMLSAGILTNLGVVRAETLSLIPFYSLLVLLRAETRSPSWRIGLVIPLIALWGTLHGAVLLGILVSGCYLLIHRVRRNPLLTVCVTAGTVAAPMCGPAGIRAIHYYLNVFGNEAARRRTELWAPLRFDRGFDMVISIVGVTFLILMLRARRPAWEWVASILMAVATMHAARQGVWLLTFCAAPAAAGLSALLRSGHVRAWTPSPVAAWFCIAASSAALLPHTGSQIRGQEATADTIRVIAAGRPVLAPEPLAEFLASRGVRLWLCDPIDAAGVSDQAAYLDFLEGGGPNAGRALHAVHLAIVRPESPQDSLTAGAGFVRIADAGGYLIKERE